jgi:hypothetical protein
MEDYLNSCMQTVKKPDLYENHLGVICWGMISYEQTRLYFVYLKL